MSTDAPSSLPPSHCLSPPPSCTPLLALTTSLSLDGASSLPSRSLSRTLALLLPQFERMLRPRSSRSLPLIPSAVSCCLILAAPSLPLSIRHYLVLFLGLDLPLAPWPPCVGHEPARATLCVHHFNSPLVVRRTHDSSRTRFSPAHSMPLLWRRPFRVLMSNALSLPFVGCSVESP